MNLETIVTQFGYPRLVTGLLFEGETVLVLAAFMAHRGYMDLPLVILTGFMVAFASDQFFFWMGRTKGNEFLEKRPHGRRMWKRQNHCLVATLPCFFLAFALCTACEPFCRL